MNCFVVGQLFRFEQFAKTYDAVPFFNYFHLPQYLKGIPVTLPFFYCFGFSLFQKMITFRPNQ